MFGGSLGCCFPLYSPRRPKLKNVHVVHSNGFFSVKSDGFVKVEIGNFKVYICFVSNTWKWVQIDNVFLQMLVNPDQGNPQTCLVGWRQTFWETFRHCLDFFFGPPGFFFVSICLGSMLLKQITWNEETFAFIISCYKDWLGIQSIYSIDIPSCSFSQPTCFLIVWYFNICRYTHTI